MNALPPAIGGRIGTFCRRLRGDEFNIPDAAPLVGFTAIFQAGVPTPVENISVIPPSAQVGPLSSMERGRSWTAPSCGTRYATDVDESAAIGAFKRRMRAARGIEEPTHNHDGYTSAWQPGDYRKFLPFDSGDRPAPARRAASWAGVAMWAAVTVSCAAMVGFMVV